MNFHDLLSLTATSRHGLEQTDIHIDLIGLHWRLLRVQAFFELLRCQPVRGVFITHTGRQGRLIRSVSPMPEVKKKRRQLGLLLRRERRHGLL